MAFPHLAVPAGGELASKPPLHNGINGMGGKINTNSPKIRTSCNNEMLKESELESLA